MLFLKVLLSFRILQSAVLQVKCSLELTSK